MQNEKRVGAQGHVGDLFLSTPSKSKCLPFSDEPAGFSIVGKRPAKKSSGVGRLLRGQLR